MIKEVNFNIKENTYKVKIDNVGQWQDIQIRKSALSKGMYGQMMLSGDSDSSFALDMIDIEATLTVLCPDIKKSYKGIDSLADLDFTDALELRKAYQDQIAPYINEIRKMLNPSQNTDTDAE